jgi:hypothetical protein
VELEAVEILLQLLALLLPMLVVAEEDLMVLVEAAAEVRQVLVLMEVTEHQVLAVAVAVAHLVSIPGLEVQV